MQPMEVLKNYTGDDDHPVGRLGDLQAVKNFRDI